MNTRNAHTTHGYTLDTLREMSEILQALDIELEHAHRGQGVLRRERISTLGDELCANHQFLLALMQHRFDTVSPLAGLN